MHKNGMRPVHAGEILREACCAAVKPDTRNHAITTRCQSCCFDRWARLPV
jgi:hypothetical protein